MRLLDKVFDMEMGNLLDLSHRTMGEFYAEELNIDIHDDCYADEGTSKAKRTRSLLRKIGDPDALRVLRALWEYRRTMYVRLGQPDPVDNAEAMFLSVLARLEGRPTSAQFAPMAAPAPAYDWPRVAAMGTRLVGLSAMEPHPRGIAFEAFLSDLFQHFSLAPRGAFSLRGEQIDGSFQHEGQTYLLEAKWHNHKTPAADLHVFEGKLGEKAVWSRGLFVSHAGFTTEGLDAFGRAKRFLCMDGLDLSEVLNRRLPLGEVIARKARRAAETGRVFVPVRELFG
jgi:hypothetical protein